MTPTRKIYLTTRTTAGRPRWARIRIWNETPVKYTVQVRQASGLKFFRWFIPFAVKWADLGTTTPAQEGEEPRFRTTFYTDINRAIAELRALTTRTRFFYID